MLDIKDIFLNSDEYYHTEFNKTTIYLHHTAGGCFVGDTMVTLVNGDDVRIDTLEKNKEYWLYGCDKDGTTKIIKCVFLGETKKVDKIVEVTLDNGNIEKCTLEHLWMMRDGTYKTANNLMSGDSLMPLYKRFDKRGYEEIKNNNNYKWHKTHQLSGKLKYGENIYKSKTKNVIHHIDFNKLNNEPDNLVLMEKNEHIIFHANLMKENWKNDEWVEKMKIVSSKNMKKLKEIQLNDDEYFIFLSDLMKTRWENGEFDYQIGSTLSEETKKKISISINDKWKDNEWSKKTRKILSDKGKKQWQDDDYRLKMSKVSKENWTKPEYREKVFQFDSNFNKKLWENPEHRKKVSEAVSKRNKIYAIYKKSEYFNKISYKEYKDTYNHKIVSVNIVDLEKVVSVYDFYSPETNNFALSSGVFVHNSRPDWVVGMWDKDTTSNSSVRHVGTSFVIGGKSTRDGDDAWNGVVVRCFPESKWDFHLGVKGSKGKFDKISIGIEICNYGPLTKGRDGSYYNYVNSIIPESDVVELPKQFRGYKYYHKYTDEQIESVKELLLYLSNKFNINLRMGLREWIEKESLVIPNGISIMEQQKWCNRYGFVGKNSKPLVADGIWGNNTAWALQSIGKSAFEYNTLTLNGYPGIWSHGNIRQDKFDISPQPNLIAMLKSL